MESTEDLKYWFRKKCKDFGGVLKEDESFNMDHCILGDVDIAMDYDLRSLSVEKDGVAVLSVEEVRYLPVFVSSLIPTKIYRWQKKRNRKIMCVVANEDIVCVNDEGEVVYALINIGASFKD